MFCCFWTGIPRFLFLLLGALTITLVASLGAWSKPPSLLEEIHKNAGVTCDQCHRENPPSSPVPTPICFQCHGSYEKLAEQTENTKPHNPHASHEGNLDCETCHHVHKPSVNYCAKCHTFGFKDP